MTLDVVSVNLGPWWVPPLIGRGPESPSCSLLAERFSMSAIPFRYSLFED
jgi:hypothetical protein